MVTFGKFIRPGAPPVVPLVEEEAGVKGITFNDFAKKGALAPLPFPEQIEVAQMGVLPGEEFEAGGKRFQAADPTQPPPQLPFVETQAFKDTISTNLVPELRGLIDKQKIGQFVSDQSSLNDVVDTLNIHHIGISNGRVVSRPADKMHN